MNRVGHRRLELDCCRFPMKEKSKDFCRRHSVDPNSTLYLLLILCFVSYHCIISQREIHNKFVVVVLGAHKFIAHSFNRLFNVFLCL